MTVWLASMLATAALSPGYFSRTTAGEWHLSATSAAACEAAAQGSADQGPGATVFLACGALGDLANASYQMSAHGLRQRRVAIAADMRATAAGAALWIRVMRGSETLAFESTADESLFDEDSRAGAARGLSVVVPSEATAIAYGVRLQGAGEVEVTDLRIDVSAAGTASPAAQRVLETALQLVKQHAARRVERDWPALETQVRIFAAGARDTADVYPAIRYLLAQIEDRRGLLLNPAVAALFTAGAVPRGGDAVGVFALPDGAKLVLTLAERDERVAQVFVQPAVTIR